MNRRSFIASTAAFLAPGIGMPSALHAAASPAKVELGEAAPFSLDALKQRVRLTASKDYVPPASVPAAWRDLTYDQYKNIIFNHDAALWRNTERPFEIEFFPPGLYFPNPISVGIVDGDTVRPVLFDKDVFTFTDQVPDLPVDDSVNYSGLRLNALLNDPLHKSEFAVFQGASYFRSFARGQIYGLSARGLAIDTGEPQGEEFPMFRKFFVEQPERDDDAITVHAVMDSPSVAGLFSIRIAPGDTTVMDVEAMLIPRRELSHVGVAPGTSMFLYDETNRSRFDDFRPAVHDSDGLMIVNGAGETLWRSLANPKTLQISSFVDNDPTGFGLMQRARKFSDFADIEAKYEQRPSLWVEPGEGWGRGAVTLVEIPADKEIYDNIVAYWRPRVPWAARQEQNLTYRLSWGSGLGETKPLMRVVDSLMGASAFTEGRIVAIDFERPEGMTDDPAAYTVHASSNTGEINGITLQRNPETGGLRVNFTFIPGTDDVTELRAQILQSGSPVSEVWLYRWTG